MNRVEVNKELLRWARERAGLSLPALARRFPHLDAWERGEAHPTLKQLETFAKATYPEEFRGFAMADDLAPLVFINGADTRAAQMFTLAHELAHIWLGQSGVSDAQAVQIPEHRVERWCNEVAAELLVPLSVLRDEISQAAAMSDEVGRLARRSKVSTLVILRRMHDAGAITREVLWAAYEAEVERLCAIPRGSGGNFYLTLGARVSKRFARALVVHTLEGHSSFTEAFRLLGVKKTQSFQELGRNLDFSI